MQNSHQPNAIDHRNPAVLYELQYGGAFTYASGILNGKEPTSHKSASGQAAAGCLMSRVGFTWTELIQQTVHELRRFIRGQHTRQTDSLRNCDSIRTWS